MNWTENRKLLIGIPLAVVILLVLGVGGWFGSDEVGPLQGSVVRRGDLRISELARGNLEATDSARRVNELEGRAERNFLCV